LSSLTGCPSYARESRFDRTRPKCLAGVESVLSAIFVDRPRLAIVVAIVMTIAGGLALLAIPFAQYPDIVPPQVTVTTLYPGASSAVVDGTVAQPIEAQLVGVDKMMYMKSVSGDDGSYTLTISFSGPIQIPTPSMSTIAYRSPSPAYRRRFNAKASPSRSSHLRSWEPLPFTRRSTATILCFFPTTSPSTCSTGSRAHPASARPCYGARRTMRCAPGFGPTVLRD
jgi:hypothetical protein